ncbi:META domain-containing protein [Pedobacter sp. HMF7647]|uniref:META domain-containing protein n=1 Tax=Hufsiella arboris TaxID=2695275 RepID=A0A7K1YE02_9SPHI|nr:META domain-containing protein [Hufsiella arboris]MXV52844.1 META domain-containing protein [Hufsiella arboris]
MKSWYFIFLSVILVSCASKGKVGKAFNTSIDSSQNKEAGEPVNKQAFFMKKQAEGVTFLASGTEPFWSLEIIREESVKLKQLGKDSLLFLFKQPERAMDADIRRYHVQSDRDEMIFTVSRDSCVNAMSGEKSPFKVTVQVKKKTEREFLTLSGCGTFIPDYRLNDIWTIETIQGKQVLENEYSRNRPGLEIHIDKSEFGGNSGCNGIGGTIVNEANGILFTRMIGTMMACPGDLESRFKNTLTISRTYKIENNRLYLYDSAKEELAVFRKID